MRLRVVGLGMTIETEARDEREQWREGEGLKGAFLLTTRRSKRVTRNENRLKFETHMGVFSLATEGGDGVVVPNNRGCVSPSEPGRNGITRQSSGQCAGGIKHRKKQYTPLRGRGKKGTKEHPSSRRALRDIFRRHRHRTHGNRGVEN